jgi:hypothetical protein
VWSFGRDSHEARTYHCMGEKRGPAVCPAIPRGACGKGFTSGGAAKRAHSVHLPPCGILPLLRTTWDFFTGWNSRKIFQSDKKKPKRVLTSKTPPPSIAGDGRARRHRRDVRAPGQAQRQAPRALRQRGGACERRREHAPLHIKKKKKKKKTHTNSRREVGGMDVREEKLAKKHSIRKHTHHLTGLPLTPFRSIPIPATNLRVRGTPTTAHTPRTSR